jgi:hypothetical protein
MQYDRSKQMITGMSKPIRITRVRKSGVLLCLMFGVEKAKCE